MNAAIRPTLSGTRNGVMTPVAIMCAPWGKERIIGNARMS